MKTRGLFVLIIDNLIKIRIYCMHVPSIANFQAIALFHTILDQMITCTNHSFRNYCLHINSRPYSINVIKCKFTSTKIHSSLHKNRLSFISEGMLTSILCFKLMGNLKQYSSNASAHSEIKVTKNSTLSRFSVSF